MIIEHRMRDKHQNADSLSKKTEFYERLEQKQANQAEINERDCRTIVQQLVSSIPQEILTSTSYGQREQGSSKRKKNVTFVDQDKEGKKVEQNLLQDYLSGETSDENTQRSQDQHPGQENLVERQNRTLVSMLRVYCSRYMTDWDRYLPQVMGAYNSTQHSTTGVSPHMMLTGHEKSLPLTFFYPQERKRPHRST